MCCGRNPGPSPELRKRRHRQSPRGDTASRSQHASAPVSPLTAWSRLSSRCALSLDSESPLVAWSGTALYGISAVWSSAAGSRALFWLRRAARSLALPADWPPPAQRPTRRLANEAHATILHGFCLPRRCRFGPHHRRVLPWLTSPHLPQTCYSEPYTLIIKQVRSAERCGALSRRGVETPKNEKKGKKKKSCKGHRCSPGCQAFSRRAPDPQMAHSSGSFHAHFAPETKSTARPFDSPRDQELVGSSSSQCWPISLQKMHCAQFASPTASHSLGVNHERASTLQPRGSQSRTD